MRKNPRLIGLLVFVLALIAPAGSMISPANAAQNVRIEYYAGAQSDVGTAYNDTADRNPGDGILLNFVGNAYNLGRRIVGYCTANNGIGQSCANAGGTYYAVGDTFTVPNDVVNNSSYRLYLNFDDLACTPSTSYSTGSGRNRIYTVRISSIYAPGCTWIAPENADQIDALFVGDGSEGYVDNQNVVHAGSGGVVSVVHLSADQRVYANQRAFVVSKNVPNGVARSTLVHRITSSRNEYNSGGGDPNSYASSTTSHYITTNYDQVSGNAVVDPLVENNVQVGGGQKTIGIYPNGGDGIKPSQIPSSGTPNSDAGLFVTDSTNCYGGGGGVYESNTVTNEEVNGHDGCGGNASLILSSGLSPLPDMGVGASVAIVDGVPTFGSPSLGSVTFRYTIKPYSTITYHSAGGTAGQIPASFVATQPTIPTAAIANGMTLSSYAFDGWCTQNVTPISTCASGNGTRYAPGASIPVDYASDLDLYALWVPQVAVTYNANGATGTVPSARYVTAGNSVDIDNPSQLSYAGAQFLGWCSLATNLNQSCAEVGGIRYLPGFINRSITPVSDTTLYAVWGAPHTDAYFSSITFSTGITSPTFDTSTLNYAISVPSGVNTIKVTVHPHSPDSFPMYFVGSLNDGPDPQLLTTDVQSSNISINSSGSTIVTVVALSEAFLQSNNDFSLVKFYVFTITHPSDSGGGGGGGGGFIPAPVIPTPAPAIVAAPPPPPPASVVINPIATGSAASTQLETTEGTTWAITNSSSAASGITVTESGSLTVAPTQAPGKYTVSLVSTDAAGTKVTTPVTIVVPGIPQVVVKKSETGAPVVSVTDPVDEKPTLAVVSTDKGVAAAVDSGALKVIDPTFSGNLSVQVKASNQYGLSSTTAVTVVVNPTDVKNVAADVTTTAAVAKDNTLAKAAAVVSWEPAPNAISYQVKVDGKVVAQTTRASISVPNVYGPAHKVEVIPLGNDGTVGNPIATSIPVKSIAIGTLSFKADVVTLTAGQKRLLDKVATSVKVNGITSVTLDGIVAAIGAASDNKKLAKARATAVKTYLESKVPSNTVKIVVKATSKVVKTTKASSQKVNVVLK